MSRAFLLVSLLLAAGCAAPGTGAECAVLGLETSAPSSELAAELGLPFEVRQQGRVVERAGDPAASAGVRAGDVLLAAGEVELFSQDDLDDVVSCSQPGDELVLALRRRGEDEERKIAVRLSGERGERHAGVAWRHASLAALPRALEEARATDRRVLVGLSGAET